MNSPPSWFQPRSVRLTRMGFPALRETAITVIAQVDDLGAVATRRPARLPVVVSAPRKRAPLRSTRRRRSVIAVGLAVLAGLSWLTAAGLGRGRGAAASASTPPVSVARVAPAVVAAPAASPPRRRPSLAALHARVELARAKADVEEKEMLLRQAQQQEAVAATGLMEGTRPAAELQAASGAVSLARSRLMVARAVQRWARAQVAEIEK